MIYKILLQLLGSRGERQKDVKRVIGRPQLDDSDFSSSSTAPLCLLFVHYGASSTLMMKLVFLFEAKSGCNLSNALKADSELCLE
jgi:hypothetical protein